MTAIGFIGAGVMAEAIISGMLQGGFSAGDIHGADPDEKRRAHMRETYGIHVTEDNLALADACEVLVLAVKPKYYPVVARLLRNAMKPKHRLISIMAGISTTQIEHDLRCFEEGQMRVLPVVRVMPNTPAMVRSGVTSLCAGSMAGQADIGMAKGIFGTVGTVLDVEERLLDAATGVAGCGPAYVYMLIEAMADGGVMMGLPRDVAQGLAAEMVRGSAEMILAGLGHPGELKDKVCSPGGATIEGVYALEGAGFRGIIMDAVKAGTEKCGKL